MTKLNAAQVQDVLAPSKRYDAATYEAIVQDAISAKEFAQGNIESQFPGVKPAHVAHMLKQFRGDRKDLVVDTHAVHGVCLIKVAPATKPATAKATAKKAATPKAKPAAKPATATTGKKRTAKAAAAA